MARVTKTEGRAMIRIATIALFAVLATAGGAYAIDHGNLDEGRPLRLEDAYPIAHGEFAIETGGGFTLQRRGADRGLFPIELLYGALPNLQVGIGTALSTDPREIDDRPKSGDLRLSALYNFNQETLTLPAFAVKLSLDAPTGVDAHGFGVEPKGIVTKSIERLSLHLNAGYEFITSSHEDERDGRYKLAIGASYPVGAPRFTRATLLGDVFAEQSSRHGEPTTVGIELGLRYQLTPRIVWDVGVGTEFAGPANRSKFSFNTGLSFGF
jgi:outer membrane putative beta-barrel porin/alpha-amylase